MPPKISQAVLYLEKLPDDFTQEDIDEYLSMILERNLTPNGMQITK